MSNEDRARRKYSSQEGQNKFLTLFRDNCFDPNGIVSMFDFYKQSVEKQLNIRSIIKGIIEETNRHMIHHN
jgi:hypothetical protein